ncbi:methyl-accepting chemotaxis protein [Clostridium sp. CX1]|uniref:methyl-accepting chemotaxis protein n=1 Tax=Clostridium sp. CX1 TaxID=2978346 RepID=UPI0021C2060F|nr:methyl-accepting chemotaxis protein [Clostridium sp. CX1]MCT8975152.1 methyl-accepting chemotaxis protein [Clostridium sp. CX1]
MVKSIKIKLLIFTLVLSLIPLLITNSYQLLSYSSNQNKEITAHLQDLAESKADGINLWMEEKIDLLDAVYKSHPEIQTTDENSIVPMLESIKGQYAGIDSVVFSDGKGNAVDDKGKKSSVIDREYFLRAQKGDSIILSDIVTSKSTGKNVIVFIKPIIKDGGEFKGLFMLTVDAERMIKTVQDIKIGETGYGYLINKNTTVFLFHPTKENIGKKYAEVNPDNAKVFQETVFKNHSGNLEYIAFDKTERLGYYHAIDAANWQLVVTGKTSEVLEGLNKNTKVVVSLVAITVITVILLSIVIGTSFVKPIEKVTELLVKTEQLDLVKDDDIEKIYKKKDETGVMAKALENTRKTMREIIEKIQQTYLVIEKNIKELSSTLGETTGSIESIAKAIDDMAQGSTELAKNTQISAVKLEMLSKEIEDANNTSSQIRELIDESKKAKDNGIEVAAKLQSVVEKNKAVASRVGEKVVILDEKSRKISVITETIKNITSQINLLSLNAAIESARAGEAGKGFAVVSNEIKKLASDTAESTVEIENIIEEFKGIIESTKGEMIVAGETIENTSEMSKVTEEAFVSIDKSVTNIIEKIDSLIKDIGQMSKDKKEVVKAIEDISAVVEEAASTTEEISASTQQQSASIEQISNFAEKLYNIAIELEDLITKFKV